MLARLYFKTEFNLKVRMLQQYALVLMPLTQMERRGWPSSEVRMWLFLSHSHGAPVVLRVMASSKALRHADKSQLLLPGSKDSLCKMRRMQVQAINNSLPCAYPPSGHSLDSFGSSRHLPVLPGTEEDRN